MALVPLLLASGPLATDQDLAGAFNFSHSYDEVLPIPGASVADGDLQHWWGLTPDPLAAGPAPPAEIVILEGVIYECFIHRHNNNYERTSIVFTGNTLGEVENLP